MPAHNFLSSAVQGNPADLCCATALDAKNNNAAQTARPVFVIEPLASSY
jgi:hypothetical protein